MPAGSSTIYFLSADDEAVVEEGYFSSPKAAEDRLRAMSAEAHRAYLGSEICAVGAPIEAFWILTKSEDAETEDGYEVDEEIAHHRAECLNGAKWECWTDSVERAQGMSFKEYAEEYYGGAIRIARLEPHEVIDGRRSRADLAKRCEDRRAERPAAGV